jgi:outer membrane receptor protein involved in Fe transport
MKKFLLLFLFAATGTLSFAQSAKGIGKISGVVRDSTNQAVGVEFANIALLDPITEKPIDGAMADEKGKFTITKVPAGKYALAVSFLGFETKILRNITISEANTDIDLGSISIGQTAKVLKEVVVEGQKSLIEEKVDRTVYNAENDQTAKGGDATDVLKRVPMLSVDMDGNVSLRGSQNIKVLINNKPSTISASSVADALKQIPADQIKTVEVITSPSAKYDAEGSAGIINIITKKNTLQGASLNIDGSAGYRGSNFGLNGSYRKNKMGFSLGGFGRGNYNTPGEFYNSQITTDTTGKVISNVQSAKTRNQGLFGNYTLGWDYDIDKFNSLTASVKYGIRNMHQYQDNLLTVTVPDNDPGQQTSSLKNVNVQNSSGTVDASLNYTHTFEKPNREFNILTLFSQNNGTNDFVNAIVNENDHSPQSYTKNNNKSVNQESTLQADYQTPLGENQLVEVGGKSIMRKVNSNYQYFLAGADGNYYPNPITTLSNALNYSQNISAGYFSYTLTAAKVYSLKAGARYEYTTINAHLQDEKQLPIPSYGVLVPSVNLSKKLDNGNVIKIAYNRRIQRPSMQYLNPNKQASNPLNSTQGNPGLSPEYTNNFELSYSTYIGGSSLNFSTFARNTHNAIQSIRDVSYDTIRTTYRNIGKQDAYGFSVFTNIAVSNKFNLNGGTDMYYAVLKSADPDPNYAASNQGWVINGRLFGSYTLPKGWGLQFFGFIRGRQVQLQGTQGGFRVYSLSIKKDLLDKKGSIGFGAENFATPTIKINNYTNSPIVNQYSSNTMHYLNFKITFSYRIGKLSFDDKRKRGRKSISNDDLKEGGDNNNGVQQQQGGAPAGGAPAGGAPAGTPGGQGGGVRPGGAPGQRPGSAGGQGQRPQGAGQYGKTMKKDSTQRPVPIDSLQQPVKKDSLQQNSLKKELLKADSIMQDLKQYPAKPDSTKSDTTKFVPPTKP